MTEITPIKEFDKDFQKCVKKHKTLQEDLEIFLKALLAELPDTLSGTVRISGLGKNVRIPIYKVKKFRCRELRGKGVDSGFRIIYAYEQDKDKITLIQIYHKNQIENEDKERIKRYFEIKNSK